MRGRRGTTGLILIYYTKNIPLPQEKGCERGEKLKYKLCFKHKYGTTYSHGREGEKKFPFWKEKRWLTYAIGIVYNVKYV